jgi:hypothetical protein
MFWAARSGTAACATVVPQSADVLRRLHEQVGRLEDPTLQSEIREEPTAS